MARVREEGGVAVAAGENGGTFADFVQLVETARVDYVQPSVTKIHGITGCCGLSNSPARTAPLSRRIRPISVPA